jgi:hypothetical protein
VKRKWSVGSFRCWAEVEMLMLDECRGAAEAVRRNWLARPILA